MTEPAETKSTRARVLTALRLGFLAATVAFAIWGFRNNGEEILAALQSIGPAQIAGSTVLVVGGLAITGVVWGWLLRSYGYRIPAPESAAYFFVGQLGKYIPGSVWSLAAQADMARASAIPPRTTVSVGLVFLWVHVASGIPVAAVFAVLPSDNPLDQPWLRVLAAAAGLALLAPIVLARVGRALAGQPEPPALTWRDSASLLGLMLVVWALYGTGAYLVAPPDELEAAGAPLTTWAMLTGAFALSYVVGVVIIFAPAGLGAREVTLIALTAPLLGGAAAAALALMIRLVHTVGDFTVAALSWLWLRVAGKSPTQQSDAP
jgi:uncharacterized membrane protein YbhN (UPF0104 family)